MLLKLRPSGLGSGIDKGRQDYETREGPEKHLRWFRSFAVQGPMTRADRVATFEEARLSKERERRADWQHACRPLMEEAGVAAVTRQVHLALHGRHARHRSVREHEQRPAVATGDGGYLLSCTG